MVVFQHVLHTHMVRKIQKPSYHPRNIKTADLVARLQNFRLALTYLQFPIPVCSRSAILAVLLPLLPCTSVYVVDLQIDVDSVNKKQDAKYIDYF